MPTITQEAKEEILRCLESLKSENPEAEKGIDLAILEIKLFPVSDPEQPIRSEIELNISNLESQIADIREHKVSLLKDVLALGSTKAQSEYADLATCAHSLGIDSFA